MKKTPKKILEASRKLFNKQGFSQVTIRMIAQELGMSSGNLNYHFKKREDILEALYFEMVAVFDQRVQEAKLQSFSLKKIRKDILESMKRMTIYRFFWTDLYNLLKQSEKIREHFIQVYQERKAGYQHVFKDLEKQGLINRFLWQEEQHFLIERMIQFSNTWLYASALYEREINRSYIALQADSLLAMLYPYLTEKGKKEFEEIIL